jgi:hypothetical protein
MASSSPAHLDGWLEKQADWALTWRRRLFHLEGLTLSYRLDEQSPDKDCAHVECMERHAVGAEHSFRLWTERGTLWVLRAESAAEHERWTEAILHGLQQKEALVIAREKEVCATFASGGRSRSNEGDEDDAAVVLTSQESRADKRRQKEVCHSGMGILFAEVEKLSAWVRSWRRRFVSLDGLSLAYSDTPEIGGSYKNRYVVRSVDRSSNSGREMLVEASTGDAFYLRFTREAECVLWFNTIRRALRTQGLRWQALTASGNAAPMIASPFHCSFVMPFSDVPTAKAVMAVADVGSGSTQLLQINLCAEHRVTLMSVDACQLAPGVKVRPCSRSMAAVALCGDTMFLHGGSQLTGRMPSAAEVSLPVLHDLWSVCLKADSGCSYKWECRVSNEQVVAWGAAGHSMVAVAKRLFEQEQNGRHEEDHGPGSVLLFIGGYGADGAALRTCRLFDPSSGVSEDFPSLDTPRCLQGTACFSDGSIVVIGGLPAVSASDRPLATASLYDPRKGFWAPLKLSQALPGMVNPCVAVVGVEMFVFSGCGKAGVLPQLFSMVVVGDTLVVKAHPCLGDTPVTQFGVSVVVAEEPRAMYVIGANPSDPAAPHLHRLLLP